MPKPIAWLAFLLTVGIGAQAQTSAPTLPTAEVGVARPGDVASPEAIVQAVYSIISGPLGAPRDWPRLRSLMAPGAIFAATGVGKTGVLSTRVLSVEEYISGASKILATQAFFERGVTGAVWRYAHIATVSSPYESRHASDESPFQRGINTFQLSYDGARWWIVSIFWEGETPAFPLPADASALLHAK
jgi:hypothetical protein